MTLLADSLAGLPAFFAYFFLCVALTAAFLGVYLRVTPHRELDLIREGNVAAAVAFAGSLIGFVLPLAAAVALSVSLLDAFVWALVALVIQVLVYFAARAVDRGVSAKIAGGAAASAIKLAALSVAGGLLQAACMTY